VGQLAGVFLLIFFLELPDKTMIATIVMSSRARPAAVALGASAGFVVQMGLAVAAGGLLTLIPARVRDVLVGAMFLGGALYLFFVGEKEEEEEGRREGAKERSQSFTREALTAAGVIFVGEFGDLTQIQAATFAARLNDPLGVFAACSLALILVAYLGSFFGRTLSQRISLSKIRFGGGVVFALLGLYTLVRAISQ
jgi:putative Ca2+/H+ antiporter (TMEM165/GDT1 family)